MAERFSINKGKCDKKLNVSISIDRSSQYCAVRPFGIISFNQNISHIRGIGAEVCTFSYPSVAPSRCLVL